MSDSKARSRTSLRRSAGPCGSESSSLDCPKRRWPSPPSASRWTTSWSIA